MGLPTANMEQPTFEDWTASELFDYLQENNEIDEDDEFDDWMHDRTDMIDMAEEYWEENH